MMMYSKEWEGMYSEHLECMKDNAFPAMSEHASREAGADQQLLRFHLRKAKKRRMIPAWSAPLEIWWLCLHSTFRFIDKYKGVGADPDPPKAPHTRDAIRNLLQHVRRSDATPLQWHRSQGVPIDKPGGKPGCSGKNLSIYLIPLEKPGLAPFYRKDQSQSYLLLGMDSQSTGVEREPFWFR